MNKNEYICVTLKSVGELVFINEKEIVAVYSKADGNGLFSTILVSGGIYIDVCEDFDEIFSLMDKAL